MKYYRSPVQVTDVIQYNKQIFINGETITSYVISHKRKTSLQHTYTDNKSKVSLL